MPGFKSWAIGEEVIQADFQGYVASQIVAQFASAAARTAGWPSPPVGAVTHLASTPGALYVWDGTVWRAGGGAPPMIRKQRSAGNVAVTTAAFTNWSDFQNADFATVMPAAAGDVLEVTLDGAWSTVAGGVGVMDAYILATGSTFGTSAAGGPTGYGVIGWGGHAIAGHDPFNGSAWRTLVAGDIAAGAATVRLRARTTGGNQFMQADANIPLTMTVRNLGQGS